MITKKVLHEWKLTIVLLFIILSLGLLLRLTNLTILPVFADEAIYIRWSQIMANESTLRFLPLIDGKQPLYMWVLMTVIHLFDDPLFAGRLVSVVAGLLTICGIFAVSYLVFKSKVVSLVSSLMWAISPFTLFFDRLALVDSMLAFWGIWTLFFALLTAKTKRIDTALFTGFCLGFAWLTKSPALFFVLLLPLTWVFSDVPAKPKNKVKHLLQLSGLALITVVLGFGMYNILRLGPNFHMIALRNLDYVYPIKHIFERPLDPLFPHFDRSMEWLRTLGPGYIFILAVSALFLGKKLIKSRVILILWFVLPLLIQSEYAKVLTARYVLFTLAPLIVLAGSALLAKQVWVKRGVYLLFGLFIVHSLIFDFLLITNPEKAPLSHSERSGYLEEWTAGTGIKEVADFIKAQHNLAPDKQIVVGTEGFFGTLPDGLQMYLQEVPNVTVIGVGLGISEVHSSLKESKKAGNKTYLVANSSRLNFKKPLEEYGLKVIASYKKADRIPALREWVQYGPYDTFYLLEVE